MTNLTLHFESFLSFYPPSYQDTVLDETHFSFHWKKKTKKKNFDFL